MKDYRSAAPLATKFACFTITLLALTQSLIGQSGSSQSPGQRSQPFPTTAPQPPAVSGSAAKSAAPAIRKIVKTPQQWRQQLTPEDYYVTRQKGTEHPFTGKHWNNTADGIFTCKCCDLPLFDSQTKYKSGTGWPSYYQPIKPENITNILDPTAGMVRTEVVCSRCDCHLGHVFKDGPRPTGLRYCINSASLNFKQRPPIQLVSPQPQTLPSGVYQAPAAGSAGRQKKN